MKYVLGLVVVAALGVFVSGCFAPTRCTSDAECKEGVCDQAFHFCVTREDGGSGGGTGGGPGADAGQCVLHPCAEAVKFCVDTAAGHECRDRYVGVVWEAPVPDGGTVIGPRTFTFQARLVVSPDSDGGGVPPAALGVSLSGAGVSGFPTSLGASGAGDLRYTAPMTFPAGGSSVRTATAFVDFDGGSSLDASVAFTVDTVPPVITLTVEAPPSRSAEELDVDGQNRWKKAEKALVRTESSKSGIPDAGEFVTPGVTSVSASKCACGGKVNCSCFEVDLGRQSLDGGIGVVQVALGPVHDVLGNVSVAIDAGIAVTRLKARWTMDGGTVHPPTAIAIANDGTVFAGGGLVLGSQVYAYGSDGGAQVLFTSNTVSVGAGPLVGELGVYLGLVDNSGGNKTSISRLDLLGTSPAESCPGTLGTIKGDLALASPGVAEVLAFVRNQRLVVTLNCDQPGTPGLSGLPTVVVFGTEAFVAGSGSAPVFKFTSVSTAPLAAGSSNTTTLFPSNLFAVGTPMIGTTLVGGGGGGPTAGGVFAVLTQAGSLTGSTTNATASAPGGAAVVGGTIAAPVVFYGDSAGVLRRSLMAFNPLAFGNFAASDGGVTTTTFADRAPILGQGGWVYVVGNDGVLRVFDSATLSEAWSFSGLLPATDKISQLNLDVNRESTGKKRCEVGQPGVLYVSAVQGTTKLYAIYVDSQGLDATAPWPRHQHNPANTGNAATGLAAWTCP